MSVTERNKGRDAGVGRESESFYLKQLYSDFVVRLQPANFRWRARWRPLFKQTVETKQTVRTKSIIISTISISHFQVCHTTLTAYVELVKTD